MSDLLYDFIYLSVKCPVCGESLMDEKRMIDGRPGIHLGIDTQAGKGNIALSSIYESYNYNSGVDIKTGEVVTFSCPHCKNTIPETSDCEHCGAPMVGLDLDIGGKVTICTRSGCKAHYLLLDDINNALKRFVHLGDYADKVPDGIDESDEGKEIIESGTFLHTYCPECERSLIDKGLVKLKIVNEDKEEGFVFLSPYLNVFTSKSTVFLKEDRVAQDIRCPHCNESFIHPEKVCEKCGSPAARISVSARTKFIDFYLCAKKGCRWHGLDEDDLHDIELEDSLEW